MALLTAAYMRRLEFQADMLAASVSKIFGGTSSGTSSGEQAASSRPDNLLPNAGTPMSATALLLEGKQV